MNIEHDQLGTYLDTLFGSHTWGGDEFLLIRGVGEKGTEQYGVFSEDVPLQPALYDPAPSVVKAADRYAHHNIGTFIVPAILSAVRATEANVKLLPAVILDLDAVPAREAIEYLKEEFAEPSMVVASGGFNDHGAKLHAYYVLDTPGDPATVAALSARLAGLVGGDNVFLRRTQPVRVPGSIHLKNGSAKPVVLESYSFDTFSIEELAELAGRCPVAPWVASLPKTATTGPGFSPQAGADSSAILTQTVRESGVDGITRWDAFSRVAGHYLHVCRQGGMKAEDAYERTRGWVASHMDPPWPDDRTLKEFKALYDREIATRGPFPEAKSYEPLVPKEEGEAGLKYWAAHRWVTEPRPEHQFLVEQMVIRGEPHLFVAEGGAGKTFMAADLAMKVAAYEDGDDLEWCGQRITAGGTVVLILCEDSKTEMHIRLLELDKGGLIRKAGDRLIVLPMTSIGGSFPLSERDPKTGISTTSQRWTEMLAELRKLPDLALVAIDTLNSITHGDENSAVVISEMMREAHRVCGELGAALIINHHIRKNNEPIQNLDDLRNSIRGSTAIPSYFRINFGMFRAGDWERRCLAIGIPAKKDAVWRMGIAKANIMGLFEGEKTLARTPNGLIDATAQDPFNKADMAERVAWGVLAVREAAKAGYPFSIGGKNAASAFYCRRSQLPDVLARLGYKELGYTQNALLDSKGVRLCAAKGEKAQRWLDIPGGPFATNDTGEEIAKGAWKAPDWNRWVYDDAQGRCVSRADIQTQPTGQAQMRIAGFD